MTIEANGYRIFILGAGFSCLAGLPLAKDLLTEVRRRIERDFGKETKFHHDLENYIEYRRVCDGTVLNESDVDLEEFMSFLDIEHYLGLRGSDTWSREGNESQLMIRKAIGQVIHNSTPAADRLPNAYYEFAKQLKPHDTIITLNYDIVLERALDHVGTAYRLFPYRIRSIGHMMDTVDMTAEEVVVLKLHGSVDWFDNREFLDMQEDLRRQGSKTPPVHSVFADPTRYEPRPILEGPHRETDPFLHIHRIRDVDAYYQQDRGFNAPFILSPSHVKFVYIEPILGFWRGLGREGGWNLGVNVIGFSLPKHDEYIRIVLFKMISNYQQFSWNDSLVGRQKDMVRIVDLQPDKKGIEAFRERYKFSDPKKTGFFLEGFSSEAVDFLFNHFHHPKNSE